MSARSAANAVEETASSTPAPGSEDKTPGPELMAWGF